MPEEHAPLTIFDKIKRGQKQRRFQNKALRYLKRATKKDPLQPHREFFNPDAIKPSRKTPKVTMALIDSIAHDLNRTKTFYMLCKEFKVPVHVVRRLAQQLRREGFKIPTHSLLRAASKEEMLVQAYKRNNPQMWDFELGTTGAMIHMEKYFIKLNIKEAQELKRWMIDKLNVQFQETDLSKSMYKKGFKESSEDELFQKLGEKP